MESRYLYAWVDFLTILFPLVFSFLPLHDPFCKKWKAFLPALVFPAILFLCWDTWFTSMGVWGFNPRYLVGSYFYYLPVEEVLWFICIPYSCIFTYVALNFYIKKDLLDKYQKIISSTLCIALAAIGLLHFHRIYTFITFISLASFLGWVQWIWKPAFLSKFYLAFLFILIPFFIVNGILTGTGIEEAIVWYNNNENLGIRIGTIPIEDTFYGMLLILMNISIFEFLQNKKDPEGSKLK